MAQSPTRGLDNLNETIKCLKQLQGPQVPGMTHNSCKGSKSCSGLQLKKQRAEAAKTGTRSCYGPKNLHVACQLAYAEGWA